MAKTVIVKLTDDIDGSDADETVSFALDGTSYEVDLSASNAAKLRDALRPYVENGRRSAGRARSAPVEDTLYSKMNGEEKAKFRSWAKMPTARRISDARVKSWLAAGKP